MASKQATRKLSAEKAIDALETLQKKVEASDGAIERRFDAMEASIGGLDRMLENASTQESIGAIIKLLNDIKPIGDELVALGKSYIVESDKVLASRSAQAVQQHEKLLQGAPQADAKAQRAQYVLQSDKQFKSDIKEVTELVQQLDALGTMLAFAQLQLSLQGSLRKDSNTKA